MTDSPKGAWLQVTGRAPVHFKTKGAAMAELKELAAKAEAAGWLKLFGSRTRGAVAYGHPDGRKRAIVVSLVDADGFELEGRERTGRRMRDDLR